jgi:hypothetical protein
MIKLLLIIVGVISGLYLIRSLLRSTPHILAHYLRLALLIICGLLGISLLIILPVLGIILVPFITIITHFLRRKKPEKSPHFKFQFNQQSKSNPPHSSSAMTKREAYQVMGLKPGATEFEIRRAHRRLIQQAHPDRGGSNYLAQKINQAKDMLLGNSY